MRFFFTGVLLHQSHKKDEQNRSGCDSNDDRNDHYPSSYDSTNRDIAISNCNLCYDLVVDTSNKIV